MALLCRHETPKLDWWRNRYAVHRCRAPNSSEVVRVPQVTREVQIRHGFSQYDGAEDQPQPGAADVAHHPIQQRVRDDVEQENHAATGAR